MANGNTKNVFVTQTKNAFLPYIQAFADFQFQYMNAQGQLAEKMYDLNKQQEGQQFIDTYGTKIREAKTPEELSKITTEAIQYGSSRGLNPQLSVVSALAQGQGNLIKTEQSKELAGLYANQFVSNYEGMYASWKGNSRVAIKDIVQDIQTMTNDPIMQVQLYENLGKNISKEEQGLTWDQKGNFNVVSGDKNPLTGRVTTTGTEPATDENLTPELAQKKSEIEMRLQEQRQQNARTYGDMNQVTMFNPGTNSYGTFLQDRQGHLFKYDEKGDKGEQVNPSGWISGVDYNRITKSSVTGVNLEKKKKNEQVTIINDMIDTDEKLRETYHTSGDPGTVTTNTGKVYLTETALNNKMEIIDSRIQKVAKGEKKGVYELEQEIRNLMIRKKSGKDLTEREEILFEKVNDTGLGSATDMRLIEVGAYKSWREDYWNQRKKYVSTYNQYSNTYGERPTFDDGEQPEPYLTNQPKAPDEPAIVEKNGMYQVYDTDGTLIGSTLSKEKADSLYRLKKGI